VQTERKEKRVVFNGVMLKRRGLGKGGKGLVSKRHLVGGRRRKFRQAKKSLQRRVPSRPATGKWGRDFVSSYPRGELVL